MVLNADGSVYHLHLRDEHVAPTVILVGDPGRVDLVASRFDRIEHRIQNREFYTVSGWIGRTYLTVLSTGIGPDNMDIVMNELDAAVNFDPGTRTEQRIKRKLNLIRLGTCGALQAETAVGSFVATDLSVGIDGVRHHYAIQSNARCKKLEAALHQAAIYPDGFNTPYAAEADGQLLGAFIERGAAAGITVAAHGFFGPQGRSLRLNLRAPEINDKLQQFEFENQRVLNYEMESAVLYSLGGALGHQCVCVCTVVANRATGKFAANYSADVQRMVSLALDVAVQLTVVS